MDGSQNPSELRRHIPTKCRARLSDSEGQENSGESSFNLLEVLLCCCCINSQLRSKIDLYNTILTRDASLFVSMLRKHFLKNATETAAIVYLGNRMHFVCLQA